jgi:hypothetical protein
MNQSLEDLGKNSSCRRTDGQTCKKEELWNGSNMNEVLK